jgi:hypothetical protein
MRANRKVLIGALWLLLGAMPAAYGDDPPAAATDAEPPSMALLEFLGEWESRDGAWIDPTMLEDWPVVEDTRGEENHETP